MRQTYTAYIWDNSLRLHKSKDRWSKLSYKANYRDHENLLYNLNKNINKIFLDVNKRQTIV